APARAAARRPGTVLKMFARSMNDRALPRLNRGSRQAKERDLTATAIASQTTESRMSIGPTRVAPPTSCVSGRIGSQAEAQNGQARAVSVIPNFIGVRPQVIVIFI